MGLNKKNLLVFSVAAVLIATFVIQTIIPLATSSTIPENKLGISKARPWNEIIPKVWELPLLSSTPFKQKIDPKIFTEIDKGAKNIEAIIFYQWEFKEQLLMNLPKGTKLHRLTSEVIKYLPMMGVIFPPNKEEIKKLEELPYVRWVSYNERLDPKKMLDYIDPLVEAKIAYKVEKPYIPEQRPSGALWYASLTDVAIETKASELWKRGITGKGVIIGIIDTGINPRHPDFFFPDGRSKIIYTFSPFSQEDAYDIRPTIFAGHGTHVASIAAASGLGEGLGWYLNRDTFLYEKAYLPKGQTIGMAPDAYLAIFKIFSQISLEFATIYHIVATIVQAVKVGVDVINASWGFITFDAFNIGLLYYAIAWAVQNGVVWVSSAGNTGPGHVTLGWPGSFESDIGVGLTYPENYGTPGLGGKVVYWSSRGPTYPARSMFQNGTDIVPTIGPASAGRIKPDILAPGFVIMAANSGFELALPNETFDPFDPGGMTVHAGTMYKTLSGTSMASPVVAGIVALLIQAFPGATPAAIKAAIIKGADPTSAFAGQNDPNIIGAGKINALKAYEILRESEKLEGFKVPLPYWQTEGIAQIDDFKQIFEGFTVLVDDVTTSHGTNPNLINGNVTDYYGTFIQDLVDRGANVTYLSNWFPPDTVFVMQNVTIESEHPYPPLTDRFWHIYHPGARAITLHFTHIGLGTNPTTPPTTATLVIYSWDWEDFTVFVPPPTDVFDVSVTFANTPGVHVRLVTDNSTGYGFQIDYYIAHMWKPSDVTHEIERGREFLYYWSQIDTEPWRTNVAQVTEIKRVPPYVDSSDEPWYQSDYNIFNINYNDLLTWYEIRDKIPLSFIGYLNRGYFNLTDFWLPLASYGLNYTSGFNPAAPPTLTDVIAANVADIIYAKALIYDPSIGGYYEDFLNFEVYRPYDRETEAPITIPFDEAILAKETVPGFVFGDSPVYTAEYLTGVDSLKWVRLVPPNPGTYIIVNNTYPLKFWFRTNGDGLGGTGFEIKFVALGSIGVDPIAPPFPPDPDIIPSMFDLTIFRFVVNSPVAEFFAGFDLVMILTPWYVDPDWIDSDEIKYYVDNYIGRLLFVGGNVYRIEFEPEWWDEPTYMLPRGDEVGTPVKMNYYTWPFGIEWVGRVAGGDGKILTTHPIFDQWTDTAGELQPMRIYFGHQIMSMKLSSANIATWVLDPVYPGIVFYNSSNVNGAVFISDPFILSDLSYGAYADLTFPSHRWFGLRTVGYLFDPPSPYLWLQKVNKWFYPIGGVNATTYNVLVKIKFDKIVYNNAIWTLNYTIINNLDYPVEINATLEIPSNSTIAGLSPVTGLNISWYYTVIPARSTVTFALGGLAYTKFLEFRRTGIDYYPVYTNLWNTFRFNTFVYANLTQTGDLDLTNDVFRYVGRSVSILNKPLPREGPLPLVTAVTPSLFDSFTSNLVAKYPLDWKYINATFLIPDVRVGELVAKITGDATLVADFGILINETYDAGVWRIKLVLVGDEIVLTPENVTDIAGPALEAWVDPFTGLPSPISDGHYPGLPHTGHFFAFVFVAIDPELPSGVYNGEVQVLLGDEILESMQISITVEQEPFGYIIWDDGLYVNNRPAVDDPDNYNGMGVAVFTTHTWGTLPWTNYFDFWKLLTQELNFVIKPSGALTIILDSIAENRSSLFFNREGDSTLPGPNFPELFPWQLEQAFNDLLDQVFGPAQGFMLLNHQNFRPFDGYYFDRPIAYAPEERRVSLTARDVMVRILAENNGTLIVFANYPAAAEFNPISGSSNPYNMNWLLSYVGSRVYYPTGINTSAARNLMPIPHGVPAGERPLTAGWGILNRPAIPYATLDFYYLWYWAYDFIDETTYNETTRKLFLDVNSLNIDAISTYSRLELPTIIETPTPYPPLVTFVYKINITDLARADYTWVVLDYMIISEGTLVEILDSNYNIVWSYLATDDTEEYGVITAPVKGGVVYVKFTAGTAVKPGFDKGIKISYVLYAPSVMDEVTQFIVWNDYDTRAAWTFFEFNMTWQDGRYRMAGYNAFAGHWGSALILDTKLSGISAQYENIPLTNAKVIAYGDYAWFDNWHFQHRVTYLSLDPFMLQRVWFEHLKVFMRAILQYVGGYYTEVTIGLPSLEEFLDYLEFLVDEARGAGIELKADVSIPISEARDLINEARSSIEIGDYITAARILLEARDKAFEARDMLLDDLEEAVATISVDAESRLIEAETFVNSAAQYNVDIESSRAKLTRATETINVAKGKIEEYSREELLTWINLIDAYKDYDNAISIINEAWTEAGLNSYNLAVEEAGKAADLLNQTVKGIGELRESGIPVSSDTIAKLGSANATYIEGVNTLAQFNLGATATYEFALQAIDEFRFAFDLATETWESLLDDASSAAREKLAQLSVRIAEIERMPGYDVAIITEVKEGQAILEDRLQEARTLDEFISIFKEASDLIARAGEAVPEVVTPTPTPTPFPLIQLAIIVILIIIIIFLVIYAITKRRGASTPPTAVI